MACEDEYILAPTRSASIRRSSGSENQTCQIVAIAASLIISTSVISSARRRRRSDSKFIAPHRALCPLNVGPSLHVLAAVDGDIGSGNERCFV